MVPEHSTRTPYRVLVPLSDNERSARAQTRFVASLPTARANVEATLTHVLHGEELDTPRELQATHRVGTVAHAREYLRDNDVSVQIRDADTPSSPTKSILSLADSIDADLVVLGGGMHGFLEDLLTGNVAKSVGRRSDRPITVVPESYGEAASEE